MTGTELQVAGEEDRIIAKLMARARIIAAMPGLKKEIVDNPKAVAAIILSLEGYGLPTTVPGINGAFDWIEGRAEPSAQMYQALAGNDGWQIRQVELTMDRAVVEISRPGMHPERVTFDLEDAKAAHRLDEWVEKWETSQSSGKKYPVRHVVRVNGVAVNVPWPDWAQREVDRGYVKRYDAWWNYRKDMLYKSAAKRAVKRACPAVLLGGSTVSRSDSEHAFVSPAEASTSIGASDTRQSDAPVPPAPAPAGETDPYVDDDTPVEGEIVDETLPGPDNKGPSPSPPAAPRDTVVPGPADSARPASSAIVRGDGTPATTATTSGQEGGPPDAQTPPHHPSAKPKPRRRLTPAKELFEVHGEGLDEPTVRAVVFSCTNGASDQVDDLTVAKWGVAAGILDEIRAGRWPVGWTELVARYRQWQVGSPTAPTQTTISYADGEEPF